MSHAADRTPFSARVGVLDRIADSGQEWPAVASKHGVENPLPPWKSSLEGICDALDGADVLSPFERRDREDQLSESNYGHLPAAERRLLALAHTLIERGVLTENELSRRVDEVIARLSEG